MSLELHSKEWFDDCFTNPVTKQPYAVPDDLRHLSERIVRSYGIRGICDPMYIANIIALETGRGDGYSTFKAAQEPAMTTQAQSNKQGYAHLTAEIDRLRTLNSSLLAALQACVEYVPERERPVLVAHARAALAAAEGK